MENWQKAALRAKEDAERIHPLIAFSSEYARIRQGKIDLLKAHLQKRPRNMKALMILITLKQERAKDECKFW